MFVNWKINFTNYEDITATYNANRQKRMWTIQGRMFSWPNKIWLSDQTTTNMKLFIRCCESDTCWKRLKHSRVARNSRSIWKVTLSVNKGVEFDLVFRYPLTPIPLCLGHVDVSMNKADKAKLMMHKFEERVESISPKEIDACAIDAMIFIQTLVNFACNLWKNRQINSH